MEPIYWKLSIHFLTGMVTITAIVMQVLYHDKRTIVYKRTKRSFIVATVVLFLAQGVFTKVDDDRSNEEANTLTVKIDNLQKDNDTLKFEIALNEAELNAIASQLVKIDSQMQPFLSFATNRYPKLGTDKALKKLNKEMKIVFNIQKNEQINAPNNRGIITQGQTGGSNIINNSLVNAPMEVRFTKWNISNEFLNEIVPPKLASRKDTIRLPNKEISNEFVYHNQIMISYIATLARNQLVIVVNRPDVHFGYITAAPGTTNFIQCQSGKSKDGKKYAFILSQPLNNIYVIDVYSIERIENMKAALNVF